MFIANFIQPSVKNRIFTEVICPHTKDVRQRKNAKTITTMTHFGHYNVNLPLLTCALLTKSFCKPRPTDCLFGFEQNEISQN